MLTHKLSKLYPRQALSFPHCQLPKFASNIIFDFFNDTTNPYVKFYYNAILIPLCDAQESCTYGNFLSLIQKASQNHTLQTWNDTCNGKPIQQNIGKEEKSPSQGNKTNEVESKDKSSNQENLTESETEETTPIKRIESYGGVNQWFIFGSAIFAALALTFLLKTFLKCKWWGPFRSLNKQDMVRYRDETEAEA